jgi:hypothetical protein
MKLYMQRTGTTHWLAQMRIGGLEHKKVLRSMELFAKHVMPALREEEAKMAVAKGCRALASPVRVKPPGDVDQRPIERAAFGLSRQAVSCVRVFALSAEDWELNAAAFQRRFADAEERWPSRNPPRLKPR